MREFFEIINEYWKTSILLYLGILSIIVAISKKLD